MDKVDIIRKHIGNDDFYDINGTPLLTKILSAMDEYAQQQAKNCSIPAVVGRSEQLVYPDCAEGKDPFDDDNAAGCAAALLIMMLFGLGLLIWVVIEITGFKL